MLVAFATHVLEDEKIIVRPEGESMMVSFDGSAIETTITYLGAKVSGTASVMGYNLEGEYINVAYTQTKVGVICIVSQVHGGRAEVIINAMKLLERVNAYENDGSFMS